MKRRDEEVGIEGDHEQAVHSRSHLLVVEGKIERPPVIPEQYRNPHAGQDSRNNDNAIRPPPYRGQHIASDHFARRRNANCHTYRSSNHIGHVGIARPHKNLDQLHRGHGTNAKHQGF